MNVHRILHTDLNISRIAYECMSSGGRCEQVAASCPAAVVELSREEWRQLLVAARGGPLP